MTTNALNPPRARNTDPATSMLAAAMTDHFASTHQSLIHSLLEKHGTMGAEQISELIYDTFGVVALDAYQVRKRLPELSRAKLAAPTGETRRTVTGRQERLWKAT